MTTSADFSLTFNDSLDIGLPQPVSVNAGIPEIPKLSIGLDPLTIEPLKPGEHVLVHVVALVDQALEPDVRYRAEISIPGLSDSRVPIAACRRVGRTAARGNRRMPQSPGEDTHDPVASLKPGADAEATEAVLRNSETKWPSPCRVDLLLACRGLTSTGRGGLPAPWRSPSATDSNAVPPNKPLPDAARGLTDDNESWMLTTIAQRYGLDVQPKRVTAWARDSANPSKQCPDMLQPAANHERYRSV